MWKILVTQVISKCYFSNIPLSVGAPNALYSFDNCLVRLMFVYDIFKVLHCNSSPHHIIVQRRPAVFGHEDGFYEETHLVNITPEQHGDFKLPVPISRHNDGNVNVAVRIGITL